VNKKPKPLPQIYSSKFINFVDKFLAKKPSDRPSAKEAVMLIPTFVKNAYNDDRLRNQRIITERKERFRKEAELI
jgi:serine/threonine protein kinase